MQTRRDPEPPFLLPTSLDSAKLPWLRSHCPASLSRARTSTTSAASALSASSGSRCTKRSAPSLTSLWQAAPTAASSTTTGIKPRRANSPLISNCSLHRPQPRSSIFGAQGTVRSNTPSRLSRLVQSHGPLNALLPIQKYTLLNTKSHSNCKSPTVNL